LIFVVRRINQLGFRSSGLLRQHFSQYGEVTRVMVAHSKVKSQDSAEQARMRPGNLGLIQMKRSDAVERILELGQWHLVEGMQVSVEEFGQDIACGQPPMPPGLAMASPTAAMAAPMQPPLPLKLSPDCAEAPGHPTAIGAALEAFAQLPADAGIPAGLAAWLPPAPGLAHDGGIPQFPPVPPLFPEAFAAFPPPLSHQPLSQQALHVAVLTQCARYAHEVQECLRNLEEKCRSIVAEKVEVAARPPPGLTTPMAHLAHDKSPAPWAAVRQVAPAYGHLWEQLQQLQEQSPPPPQPAHQVGRADVRRGPTRHSGGRSSDSWQESSRGDSRRDSDSGSSDSGPAMPAPTGALSAPVWQRRGPAPAGTAPADPLELSAALLRELEGDDEARIFVVKRINRLGYRSQVFLRQHYFVYGSVSKVLIASTASGGPGSSPHQGSPVRCAGQQQQQQQRSVRLGIVVMDSAESVGRILSMGASQVVAGHEVIVQAFVRPLAPKSALVPATAPVPETTGASAKLGATGVAPGCYCGSSSSSGSGSSWAGRNSMSGGAGGKSSSGRDGDIGSSDTSEGPGSSL